jgi:hypothetical protein
MLGRGRFRLFLLSWSAYDQGRYRRAGCQVAPHGPIGDFKLAGDLGLAESRPVEQFAKFTGFHPLNLGQNCPRAQLPSGYSPASDVDQTRLGV